MQNEQPEDPFITIEKMFSWIGYFGITFSIMGLCTMFLGKDSVIEWETHLDIFIKFVGVNIIFILLYSSFIYIGKKIRTQIILCIWVSVISLILLIISDCLNIHFVKQLKDANPSLAATFFWALLSGVKVLLFILKYTYLLILYFILFWRFGKKRIQIKNG